MESNLIDIEVAYAATERQLIVPVQLNEGATLEEAIKLSGILEQFPEIDLTVNHVGVFGKLATLGQPISPGDRVEIYRPLLQHPMEARRKRASSR